MNAQEIFSRMSIADLRKQLRVYDIVISQEKNRAANNPGCPWMLPVWERGKALASDELAKRQDSNILTIQFE